MNPEDMRGFHEGYEAGYDDGFAAAHGLRTHWHRRLPSGEVVVACRPFAEKPVHHVTSVRASVTCKKCLQKMNPPGSQAGGSSNPRAGREE